MSYQSWGRYPKVHQRGYSLKPRFSFPTFDMDTEILPFGCGRSYGDSCLNSRGLVCDTRQYNKFVEFDAERGVVTAESGVTLADIIELALPQGWFLPVTPGTKYVSLGGAVANDVHGKNHHVDGSFGHFVKSLELIRSDGERLTCSPSSNKEMFYATIGGLGLTGLISTVTLQLKSVESAYLSVDTIAFNGLDEFKQLSDESKQDYLYTVAWIDCMAQGDALGRGIFLRANHCASSKPATLAKKKLSVPFNFPGMALNKLSIKAFNQFYYWNGKRKECLGQEQHYDPYFYPLDGINDWNRIYGKRGFLQYQFVVPAKDYSAIKQIMARIADAGAGSFLAVLKEFGDIPSLGMLSFPREGVCLALDFPFQGQKTLTLLNELDSLVVEAGGAIYPAKDARMSASVFQSFTPKLEEFKIYKDPLFSSDFWRRVTEN